jgi:O-antigen ligase
MIVAAITRGGFLGVMAALMVAGAMDPMRIGKRLVAFGAAAVLLATVVVVVSTNMEQLSKFARPDSDRELSPRQVIENVLSISGNDSGTLSDTKTWRLDWWTKIVDYTLFGPFFMTGKGFGVNLADDDGFQVAAGEVKTLRSPHSGHMTVLARMGVPGAAVWIALNLTFAALLFRAYRRANRAGEWMWARVDMWILSYWAAFLVSASFDVVLEGPYGGIWFWCLIGLGVAALEVQRTRVRAAGRAPRAA